MEPVSSNFLQMLPPNNNSAVQVKSFVPSGFDNCRFKWNSSLLDESPSIEKPLLCGNFDDHEDLYMQKDNKMSLSPIISYCQGAQTDSTSNFDQSSKMKSCGRQVEYSIEQTLSVQRIPLIPRPRSGYQNRHIKIRPLTHQNRQHNHHFHLLKRCYPKADNKVGCDADYAVIESKRRNRATEHVSIPSSNALRQKTTIRSPVHFWDDSVEPSDSMHCPVALRSCSRSVPVLQLPEDITDSFVSWNPNSLFIKPKARNPLIARLSKSLQHSRSQGVELSTDNEILARELHITWPTVPANSQLARQDQAFDDDHIRAINEAVLDEEDDAMSLDSMRNNAPQSVRSEISDLLQSDQQHLSRHRTSISTIVTPRQDTVIVEGDINIARYYTEWANNDHIKMDSPRVAVPYTSHCCRPRPVRIQYNDRSTTIIDGIDSALNIGTRGIANLKFINSSNMI